MGYQYYYHQMDKVEQSVYEGMYTCFRELGKSVRVRKLDGKRLSDLFFQVRLDNPEIFYVTSFRYTWAHGADYVELYPEYLFEKSKIKEHQKALQARMTRLLRPAQGLNPWEKEAYIHRFIQENVHYDKLEKPYSHEIIGTLTHGIGVCEGIAKTVKHFCDQLGLECLVAISEADPEHGVKYRHAWNVIKLEGEWYHLDATFDLSLGRYGQPRFDYFNLPDKAIFRDHKPLLYPVPSCTDGDRFYYKVNRQSWTKVEDVEKRVTQALRKKQPGLVFHWRGGYLTREVLLELAGVIQTAAAGRGKYPRLSVNFPQAVIQAAFLDSDPNGEVVVENANEAEENDQPSVTENKEEIQHGL